MKEEEEEEELSPDALTVPDWVTTSGRATHLFGNSDYSFSFLSDLVASWHPTGLVQPWRRVGRSGTLSCNPPFWNSDYSFSFLSDLVASWHPTGLVQPWRRRVGLGRCRAIQPRTDPAQFNPHLVL